MPITQIRSLFTKYNGFAFRSRLEARLAVFMDTLGWSYEYEPQGYNLGDGNCYLPDFLVTGAPAHHGVPKKFWLEVKGEDPTTAEIMRLRRLAYGSGITGFFFVGTHRVRGTGRAIQWYSQMDERAIREASYWQATDTPVAYSVYPFSHTQHQSPDDMDGTWMSECQFAIPLTEYVPAIEAAKAHRFGT